MRMSTLGRTSRVLESGSKKEAPRIAPGRFEFPTAAAYRSSSATPTGTSCGGAGSSTRGGGAS